jgi:hypothetical protein
MKDYDVILASGAEHLRERFRDLGFRVFSSDWNYDGRRLFPNTDLYARIAEVHKLSNRKVIIFQSCTGAGPAEQEPRTTSDRLVELFLLLDILRAPVDVEKTSHKEYKTTSVSPPSNVEVVLTYQPFALQDKAFLTGEASSSRWAVEEISKACNKVWVVNPHASHSLDWIRKLKERGTLEIIDVIPSLIEFAAVQFGFDDYVVVTPDEGGQERFNVAGFGKSRKNSFTVELSGDVDVSGRNVIIVDDLTKTGSTLIKAGARLKKMKAKNIGLAVAHALPIMKRGEELLEKLISKSKGRIVATNTIYTRCFCLNNPALTYNIVDSLVKTI